MPADRIIPGKKLVAVLGNPDTPYTALALQQIKTAAATIGVPLVVLEARSGCYCAEAADEIERLQSLVTAYTEYTKLLVESERSLIGLAYVHGYRCPESLARRGEKLRQKIKELSANAKA